MVMRYCGWEKRALGMVKGRGCMEGGWGGVEGSKVGKAGGRR